MYHNDTIISDHFDKMISDHFERMIVGKMLKHDFLKRVKSCNRQASGQ
jgi:hypothetical protein